MTLFDMLTHDSIVRTSLSLCQSGASQSGLLRIRTQDQGPFGCPPGTIWATSGPAQTKTNDIPTEGCPKKEGIRLGLDVYN